MWHHTVAYIRKTAIEHPGPREELLSIISCTVQQIHIIVVVVFFLFFLSVQTSLSPQSYEPNFLFWWILLILCHGYNLCMLLKCNNIMYYLFIYLLPTKASDPPCKTNPAQPSKLCTYPVVVGLIQRQLSWFTLSSSCQQTTTCPLTAWQQLAGPVVWLGVDISLLLKGCNHLPLHMEPVQSLDSNPSSSGFTVRVRVWPLLLHAVSVQWWCRYYH